MKRIGQPTVTPQFNAISTSTRMGSGNWKTKCEFNTETKVYDVLVTSLFGRDLPSRAHWQLLAWECIKYQILACGSTVETIWCLIDSHHSSPVTFWNDAHSRIYESKIRSPYAGPLSSVSDPVCHTHIVFPSTREVLTPRSKDQWRCVCKICARFYHEISSRL